jgi:hypothetical protein
MLTKLSRSPHRNTFQKERYLANMAEQGKTAENSSDVAAMLDYFNLIDERHHSNEENNDWKKNNMEYDLCSTDWILEKVRSSDAYAQNLYAAMCNNEFQKVNLVNTPESVVQVLSDGIPVWSCSWRHAGGVIADMQQQGDYIDWYCSGLRGGADLTRDISELTAEEKIHYDNLQKYVDEGRVTDEIRADLLKLGWKVLDLSDED